jgi:hypothetical protein
LAQSGEELVGGTSWLMNSAEITKPVYFAVDGGSGQATIGDGDDPVPVAGGEYWADLFSPAGTQSRPAEDEERDVRAEVGGELRELIAGQSGLP